MRFEVASRAENGKGNRSWKTRRGRGKEPGKGGRNLYKLLYHQCPYRNQIRKASGEAATASQGCIPGPGAACSPPLVPAVSLCPSGDRHEGRGGGQGHFREHLCHTAHPDNQLGNPGQGRPQDAAFPLLAFRVILNVSQQLSVMHFPPVNVIS